MSGPYTYTAQRAMDKLAADLRACAINTDPIFRVQDPFIGQFEREMLRSLTATRASAAFPHLFRFPSEILKDPIMSNTSPQTFKHPTNGKTYKTTGTDISKVKVGDLIVGAFSGSFKEVLGVGQDKLFVRTAVDNGEFTVGRSNLNHYTVTEQITETHYRLTYDDGISTSARYPTKKLPGEVGCVDAGFIGWLEFTKLNGKVDDIKFIPYVNGQDF